MVIWHVTENRFQKLDGGHSDAVTRVSFSPNGQYLASLDNEEKLIIWSTQVLLGQILLSLYIMLTNDNKRFFNDNRIGSTFSNTSNREVKTGLTSGGTPPATNWLSPVILMRYH